MGELVARADDEAVKRIAVHLRHLLGRRALLAVFEQLIVSGEHDELKRAGEQIIQHGADRLFKARLDDAALKIRRGVHDERIIIDLNGGAIGNQVLIAVWVSSCERLSMTTDQISVSEFMVAIGSAPSMIFTARIRWYQPYQYSKNS